MQEIIIELMNKFGYFGITFLIAIENIFPPIPSEVVLTFGGFMTTYSKLTILGVIAFSTLGALIGATVLYYIGKILNKERLIKIVSGKVGKILFLNANDIEKADAWFKKAGNKAVFFCRFVPIIRSLISLPAGMSNMSFKSFILFTTFGTLIWNSALIFIGSVVGASWGKIVDVINKYAYITLIILVLVAIIGVIWFYKTRKGNKKRNGKKAN
ncbi:MAG: DedA family protein [Bacilli bacterium]